IRPNIKALQPYRSARQDFTSGILLDANENAFGSPVSVDGITLNRYPDPSQIQLRRRIAQINDVDPEQIFVGVGSDEIIDLLIRLFCQPGGDSVIVLAPTYGVYRVAAEINDVRVNPVLLTESFEIDVPAVMHNVSSRTKMVFCCSPNNPTGNLLRAQDIAALCRRTEAIIVVDEAYIDLAQAQSLCHSVPEYPNLVVLRTLSKAWGLAGIRLGYAIANEQIVSYLLKIKSPYNINALTSEYALKALDNWETVERTVSLVIKERNRLSKELSGLREVTAVFPSRANFLLVRFADGYSVYNELANRGIIVRYRGNEPNLENCIRITVGTPQENNLLLLTLKEMPQ
ncbi:MAG: histidinol-phosphate transaminase, partial [Ignavibacteriales bacterium]|nr:histidinol-phosphate transaminase [Ignavibacteriales bacterium]